MRNSSASCCDPAARNSACRVQTKKRRAPRGGPKGTHVVGRGALAAVATALCCDAILSRYVLLNLFGGLTGPDFDCARLHALGQVPDQFKMQ